MTSRREFELMYQSLHRQLVAHPTYAGFVNKGASKEDAMALVKRVCKAHLRSPNILGFLYAIVPPSSRDHLEHNLMEELGREHEGEPSHPDLLKKLGRAIGIDDKAWAKIEEGAEEVLRNKAVEPIMFGTLAETGLNVALEVFAFEWVLSRESRRIGDALQYYLRLDKAALEWFFHHSEVDIEHAEQGLDALANYVQHYNLDTETVRTIAEITFRENIFLKRYFDLQVSATL